MKTGRLIGMVLMVIGFFGAVTVGLWIVIQIQAGVERGGFSPATGVLTGGIVSIPVALLVGVGVFLFVRSGQEIEVESTMHQQRQLLDIVKNQGQVKMADLAQEMQLHVDVVGDLLQQLVGLQVFSGYVNWDEGIVAAADAGALRELKECQTCGREINLVGKGAVACKSCGTEYFLP